MEFKVNKIRLKNEVFDPIRFSNGKCGWIKKQRGGVQTIVESTTVKIGADSYTLSFPNISPNALILPSGPGVEREVQFLFEEIKKQVEKALILPSEESLTYLCTYIFATWNYDLHPNVGYVAFTGLPGSGKSQALKVCSRLAYNVFVGSGADTDAAIVRGQNAIRGTLALDEAQRNVTDTSSIFHKILAQGSDAMGVINKTRQNGKVIDFENESFFVFGPKILSGRSVPGEEAILSRTYEIKMPQILLSQFKINVDTADSKEWQVESDRLRNNLLLYRQMRALGEVGEPGSNCKDLCISLGLSGRDYQVYRALFLECPNEEVLSLLEKAVLKNKKQQKEVRSHQFDAQVLRAAYACLSHKKSLVADVVKTLQEWAHDKTNSRGVGKVLRAYGVEIYHSNAGNKFQVRRDELEKRLAEVGIDHSDSSLSSLRHSYVDVGDDI